MMPTRRVRGFAGKGAVCLPIALAVSCFSPGAHAETTLRLARLQQLLEQAQSDGKRECFPAALPVAVAGPYAVVAASVLCSREGGDERNPYEWKGGFWAVVDWKQLRVVAPEIESGPNSHLLDLAQIEGRPALLAAEGRELVLYLAGQDGPQVYRWLCPPSACPSFPLQAQLLEQTRFPWEAVRVLVVAGEAEFLVHAYDLYPPGEDGEPGRVQKVDEFVPAALWKQEFGRATNLEEEAKKVFLDRNVLLEYASKLPLLDKEVGAMALEAADRYVENAWRGISIHAAGEQGIFFATQQPFALTRLDPQSGKFQIHSIGEFGKHVRPLSLSGNLSLLGAFPIGAQKVGLVVRGPICESAAQYRVSHGGAACPGRQVEREPGQEACCYSLTALVRHDLKTDSASWDIWEDYDKRGEPIAQGVVEVSRAGATCLVATPDGVIRRESCGAR